MTTPDPSPDVAGFAARLFRSIRLAVEVVGWLIVATATLGGLHAVADGKPVDWALFWSGGIWIGLPFAVAVGAYISETTNAD